MYLGPCPRIKKYHGQATQDWPLSKGGPAHPKGMELLVRYLHRSFGFSVDSACLGILPPPPLPGLGFR